MPQELKNAENIDAMLHGVSMNMQRVIMNTLRLARTPIKSAVLVRVLDNITRTVELMDSQSLEHIAGEPYNLDVLLSLSEESILLESNLVREDDPLRSFRLKGIRAKNELLKKEGGVISSSQVAELMEMSRQAVDKRRKQGKLLAVSVGKRGYVYPVWQFTETGVLSGFEQVMEELKDYDPWMRIIFMLNANEHLENHSPLEKLREGEIELVTETAKIAGEQGAS
jgi:hypothetical protein